MEQYASPLRQQKKRDGPQWLVQALVCAGALVAAGALTIEARISTAAVHPQDPPQAAPQSAADIGLRTAEAPMTQTDHTAEVSARAAAQKTLAEALARASAVQTPSPASVSNRDAAAPVSSSMEPAQTAAAPPASPLPAASPPPAQSSSAAGATQPTLKQIPDAELKLLALKAAQALKTGDIGGARMVLERAAGAGDATALFALGETYDPDVLAKMRVRGLRGDREKAIDLYRRASQAGVAEAQKKLETLPDGRTASAK